MTPRLRKLTLTAHVTFSVGWLGAVVAYLAPAIVGLTSSDLHVIRSCHLVMAMMGWYVLVPLALGALLTGLIQSLFTEWGLVRHYWIATKLALSLVGVVILFAHMRGSVSRLAGMTPEALATANSGHLKVHLVVHAVGGLVILLVATTLSIFKPWGKTRFGKRATNAL